MFTRALSSSFSFAGVVRDLLQLILTSWTLAAVYTDGAVVSRQRGYLWDRAILPSVAFRGRIAPNPAFVTHPATYNHHGLEFEPLGDIMHTSVRLHAVPFTPFYNGTPQGTPNQHPGVGRWRGTAYGDAAYGVNDFGGRGIYPNGYRTAPYVNHSYQGHVYPPTPGTANGYQQYMMTQNPVYTPYAPKPVDSAYDGGVGFGQSGAMAAPKAGYTWPSSSSYSTYNPNTYAANVRQGTFDMPAEKTAAGGVYGSERLRSIDDNRIRYNSQQDKGKRPYISSREYHCSFRRLTNDVVWFYDYTPNEEWPGTSKLKLGEPFYAVIRNWLTPVNGVVLSVDKMVECCLVADGVPQEFRTPTMRCHFKAESVVEVRLKWPQEYDDKGRPIVVMNMEKDYLSPLHHVGQLVWSTPMMINGNQAIMRLEDTDELALLYFCELCTDVLDNEKYKFTHFLSKGDRIQIQLTHGPSFPKYSSYRARLPWNSPTRLEWAEKYPEIKELIAPCEYDTRFITSRDPYSLSGTFYNGRASREPFENRENKFEEDIYALLPTPTSPLSISEFTRRIGGKLKDVLRFLLLQAQAPIDKNAPLSVNLAKSVYNFVAGRTEFNDIDEHMREREMEILKGKSELVSLERPPVVVLMGHINHGKTALFDMLTNSTNVENEPGNITQTVRTYTTSGECPMTLIDTPGHEVFYAMRRCGAGIADIALIAVDAVEGLKEQSIESIKLCKSLRIPFIIAATKCDLPNAQNRAEELAIQLSDVGVLIEGLGGDIQFLQVSSKQDTDNSKQAIFNAIMLQSAASDDSVVTDTPGISGRGFVLESGKGQRSAPYCLAIIKQGVITKGGYFVSGKSFAKINGMKTPDGKRVTSAKPSQAVFVDGFEDDILPSPGTPFVIYDNENDARCITDHTLETELAQRAASELQKKINDGINVLSDRIVKDHSVKQIPVLIKGGTQGSVDAVKLATSELKVEGMTRTGVYDIISTSVGPIYKSDILDAHDSKAVILGLDSAIRADAKVEAKKLGVTVITSDVIYDLMDRALEALREGLGDRPLTALFGTARVLKVFDAVKNTKAAGCVVMRGRIPKDSAVRVLRDNKPVFAGKLSSLRQTTDSIDEAVESQSCGMIFDGWNDVKADDIIEAYAP
ncbi:Translation initiation factor IF-2 [Babesia sp. Xinjiang]|uniref:Translation initiation factor IF-2 n=1 Tax=Babesia sp. Xinjiang TaxID=462227 RepID=UPI000A228FC8|nr:Translation initiation factor IF-2 [Babesia sp. Xinjiang]ORM40644.1 Translation initiation factor IF-2 [Babesia sp. Xinjiang]